MWALVGDGTYLMNPTEIVTAVQENLPVKLVLVQNHGYASIGGLSESVGAERFGTDYRHRAADGTFTGAPAPRRPRRQRGQPRHGRTARQDGGGTAQALRTARSADRPTCVYVETDPAPQAAPPAAAWWDVPVAEVSAREAATGARAEYERAVADRRRHL